MSAHDQMQLAASEEYSIDHFYWQVSFATWEAPSESYCKIDSFQTAAADR